MAIALARDLVISPRVLDRFLIMQSFTAVPTQGKCNLPNLEASLMLKTPGMECPWLCMQVVLHFSLWRNFKGNAQCWVSDRLYNETGITNNPITQWPLVWSGFKQCVPHRPLRQIQEKIYPKGAQIMESSWQNQLNRGFEGYEQLRRLSVSREWLNWQKSGSLKFFCFTNIALNSLV